ncbi:MAG: heavy-metal-associated domain-containing protein, partial [Muribaculaceae bacterium]|nr:heavy-metal-associated domain-containing protein [Muribaculaceae bacterium]
ANVERALSALEGVETVRVDLASGTAAVTGTADPARIVATVRELGYECTE